MIIYSYSFFKAFEKKKEMMPVSCNFVKLQNLQFLSEDSSFKYSQEVYYKKEKNESSPENRFIIMHKRFFFL